ncbi:MAG TPA: NADP-dependent oxidoreductase [Candidatus Elarobacter sp.]|jgi:NADPH:quinone reductase-like Zn-dependent oxidoreductase|nr:NADP-dependent oxidoreductase [Candidatus Elarobacter sp.]
MMRAVVIDAFGGPERLVTREVAVPAVGVRDVLVRVDTAGVAVSDVKARRGEWGGTFPMILGADGSGTVVALGEDVRGFELGEAVYGYAYGRAKGGFYAEYVSLSAEHVAPMPSSLDFREAGGLALTGLTALAGIDDALDVRPGWTLLVHGASGGVGTIAVQFAKRRGARVIATVNGGEARELVRRLGADEIIDTQHEDVLDAVRRIAPGGADALLALVAGPALERCVLAVRDGGKIAYPNGVALPSDLALPGGVHATAFNGVPNAAAFARLNAIVDEAPVQVPIAAMYSLDDAAEAHRRLERGHVHGKIVLVVDATEDVVEKVA